MHDAARYEGCFAIGCPTPPWRVSDTDSDAKRGLAPPPPQLTEPSSSPSPNLAAPTGVPAIAAPSTSTPPLPKPPAAAIALSSQYSAAYLMTGSGNTACQIKPKPLTVRLIEVPLTDTVLPPRQRREHQRRRVLGPADRDATVLERRDTEPLPHSYFVAGTRRRGSAACAPDS